MTSLAAPSSKPRVVYPDSDGKPMAENTLQWQWIVTITGGLSLLFADDPNVFVAGDLFWYPVEGHPEIVTAPDTMVAFGRPKGHRMSYMQWLEGGVPPQVVFEVLSPGNRFGEMSRKFAFYQRHGVEEYYIYNPDPDRLELAGFLRRQTELVEVEAMSGHKSPRLGIRFEMGESGLRIIRPDGKPFETFEELGQRAEHERQRAEQALRELEQLRQQLRPLTRPRPAPRKGRCGADVARPLSRGRCRAAATTSPVDQSPERPAGTGRFSGHDRRAPNAPRDPATQGTTRDTTPSPRPHSARVTP